MSSNSLLSSLGLGPITDDPAPPTYTHSITHTHLTFQITPFIVCFCVCGLQALQYNAWYITFTHLKRICNVICPLAVWKASLPCCTLNSILYLKSSTVKTRMITVCMAWTLLRSLLWCSSFARNRTVAHFLTERSHTVSVGITYRWPGKDCGQMSGMIKQRPTAQQLVPVVASAFAKVFQSLSELQGWYIRTNTEWMVKEMMYVRNCKRCTVLARENFL